MSRLWLATLVLACALGCGATVRPQTVLVVDTDLPIEPGRVPVAAVDTLRIDVFAAGATVPRETREFVVGHPGTWPLSLGVVGPARVRLRLFAARWSSITSGTGAHVREPRPEVTVDRLVDVTATDEVARVRLTLAGDCIGRPADLATGRTCAGGGRLDVAAGEALPADDGSPARVGSWPVLTEVPCTSAPDPARPCVAGGYDVVGDPELAGLDSRVTDPIPLRPVWVSPVRMDRLEYTVMRYRALVAGGFTPSAGPPLASGQLAYCIYRGDGDATVDSRPLNCVTHALAEELCAHDGGRLPTETEWEHAASGRGEGRLFPWGNTDPACCTVSLSRSPRPQDGAACGGLDAPEPAGSHDGSTCNGVGDVSRDGILDLGGSLFELTEDHLTAVADCHPPGLARDPVCLGGSGWVLKSADWTAGIRRARVGFRVESVSVAATQGFRCVYPEPP